MGYGLVYDGRVLSGSFESRRCVGDLDLTFQMVQPNQGPLPTTLRQPFSNGFRQESSDVARAGLAEERTEEFLKPARVGQLTCVNRRDSADTDFPRLRKHYWHRDGDRLSMF